MSTLNNNEECPPISEASNHSPYDRFLADDRKARRIALVRSRIRYEFDSLLRIIDLTERAIVEEQQRKMEPMKSNLANFLPGTEEYGFTRFFFNNDLQHASEDMPRAIRYALLSAMISVTETSFVHLTRLVQSLGDGVPEFDDRKNPVIENAASYLEKHGRLRKQQVPSLDTLLMLVAIRNCVIHNGGDIDRCGKRDQIRQYIEDNPSSTVDGKGRILLASNFLRNYRHVLSYTLMRYCDALERTNFP